MQSLDAFMSRLMPQVMGCPDPIAAQALRDSAIEFCEETNAVQVVTDPAALSPGVKTYDLDIPTGCEVARVLRAWCGRRQLALVSQSVVDEVYALADPMVLEDPTNAPPKHAVVTERGALTLYPAPDSTSVASERLTVLVATKPERGASRLDDALYLDWAEAVVSGAIYRLADMPNQAFTNPKQAKESFARFRYWINRAHIEANRGRTDTQLRVRSRPFA